MNSFNFNDLVQGRYGRKIAYTDVEKITADNVVDVLGKCIGVFNYNKPAIKYLHDYYKGDQPALYRTKVIRDDLPPVNVVENHAWEIVRFKVGQTYGEPMQYNSLKDDDNTNKYVDKLNGYMRAANKAVVDITSGTWQSSVGTSFKAVQLKDVDSLIPFRLVAPTPMNTFVIYSRYTEEPMMAVQELKDANGNQYYLCFTDRCEYRIQGGKLMSLDEEGRVERLHTFGQIPIVEFPNNSERISDIELVITMLDAINNMQSNRMDAIDQFVQSWVKFVNCDIDAETFDKMKMRGALVVKSNNGDSNRADVDIMTQELNQSESQVAKKDLLDNVLMIEAIPNREGNTGGDTQGAVSLRNGWDFAKQAARLKDAYIVEAENRLVEPILNCIRVRKGANDCPLTILDFEPQVNHSPTDNLQVKAQSLQMLLQAGISPLVAIRTVGLWSDAEKTYLLSKPYLDVIYKTIDEVIEQENLQAEMVKAQQLMAEVNTDGETRDRQTE